jgi:3-hydroxyisobutyrate dehydrogenase-like beta-hydroxyacid dehydrogenase
MAPVPVRVAVLGLGEAGSRYAADLVACGWLVTGYDPVARPAIDGLRAAPGPADAVTGADVVLSLNSAAVAVAVAMAAAPGLAADAVYADLNTTAPRRKQEVAAVIDGTAARFVDAAVLAPVPRAGLRTPLLLAGAGRERLAALLGPLGVPTSDAGPDPGAAAGAKLLRSVFMKGLAAVIGEALDAASAAGQRDWLHDQIVGELSRADAALVTRLVEGTLAHAGRRTHEMRAAVGYLAELGVSAHVSRATYARLADLAAPDEAAPDEVAPDEATVDEELPTADNRPEG